MEGQEITRQSERIDAIDAARGMAMFLVCLSHFKWIYGLKGGLNRVLDVFVFCASPTFMIISGIMLGILSVTAGDSWESVKDKLIDRGLFLLTIGHLLIVGAHIALSGSIAVAFRWAFITDAIGFSVIAGSYLIRRIKMVTRAILSIALFALAWLIILEWNPESTALLFLKETLFGSLGRHVYVYNHPLLIWFALYFGSTCIGEQIGSHYKWNKDFGKICFSILKFSVAFVSVALTMKLIGKFLTVRGLVHQDNHFLFFMHEFYKFPPTPFFFLFFGGIGLLLIYFMFKIKDIEVFRGFYKVAIMLGKTSLFVFILQYYFYYTGLFLLHLNHSKIWELYFIASFVLIVVFAKIWLDKDLNRFITVKFFLPRVLWRSRIEAGG